MYEKNSRDTIAIDTAEARHLTLCQRQDTQDEGAVEDQQQRGADEARFLAHGAEDEVCLLLGHVVQLGLRPLEEALARQPSRADSDLGLVDIVALTLEVALDAKGDLDTHLLVGLQDLIEDVAHRVEEAHRA